MTESKHSSETDGAEAVKDNEARTADGDPRHSSAGRGDEVADLADESRPGQNSDLLPQ